ncbi:hypothetical protein P7C71_g1008, partial [Lecanoromycetidae sp. Uapishka_2]
MGFLKHIRSRSRLKSADDTKYYSHHATEKIPLPKWARPNPTAEFPAALLEELLSWEVQQCSDIRQMKYTTGAEGSFQNLAQWRQWRNLETLELIHLALEPATLVEVFVTLAALRAVRLVGLELLDDSIFMPDPVIGSFPPIVKLTLQDIPNVSANGLASYFSQSEAKNTLDSLTLINTGVLPSDIHQILSTATRLTKLQITEGVSRALPPSSIPPLASRSLQTLHYEISNVSSSPAGLQTPAESYYAYLCNSILEGSLPSLSNLYALSPNLPHLLLTPPRPKFMAHAANRTGHVPSPLLVKSFAPLNLYTKSISELEWELTIVTPPTAADRRGSVMPVGPESLYHESPLSPQWRKQGRESVMVGNGFGGFLSVPSPGEDFRPGSPRGKKKRQDLDSWMG